MNYKKAFIFTLTVGLVFLLSADALAVGDAYFPQDTTLQITVGSTLTSYTINAGSDADSLVVNPSSFVITISAGERFIVGSSARHLFVNDGGYSTNCASGTSSALDITGGSTQKVITVTPDGTTCTVVSGGGGGTGGGGSAVGGVPTQTTAIASTSPLPTPVPVPSLVSRLSPVPSAQEAVKLFRKAGDPKVYIQGADGLLRWVRTLKDFNAAGYSWADVQVVADKDFVKLRIAGNLKVVGGIGWLNVRDGASLRSKIIGRALPNQELDKLGSRGGWLHIVFNGGKGWVFAKYVIGQ